MGIRARASRVLRNIKTGFCCITTGFRPQTLVLLLSAFLLLIAIFRAIHGKLHLLVLVAPQCTRKGPGGLTR